MQDFQAFVFLCYSVLVVQKYIHYRQEVIHEQYHFFSSVYLYLNGYEEDGFLRIQAVNTYQYMEETFYQQVVEQISMTDKEEKTAHVFAVLGAKEKAKAVYRLLEDEPVVSKDLHQTMNSRYVYLPYLWPLVPHPKMHAGFSPSVLHDMTKKAMCALIPIKKELFGKIRRLTY